MIMNVRVSKTIKNQIQTGLKNFNHNIYKPKITYGVVILAFPSRRTCSDCGERTSSSLTNRQVPVQDERCSCGVQPRYDDYPRWSAGLDGTKYSETSPDKKKKGLVYDCAFVHGFSLLL